MGVSEIICLEPSSNLNLPSSNIRDASAAYIKLLIEKMEYPEAIVSKKYLFYQGESLEINIFCEEPLIVGEVAITVKDEDKIEKLLVRIEPEEPYMEENLYSRYCQ